MAVMVRLHSIVNLLPTPTRGKSYWKLNTAILHDDSFLPSFRKFWSILSSRIHDYHNVADSWDLCAKPEIRSFCICYSIQRKHSNDQTERFLLAYLQQVMIAKNWSEIAKVKEELKNMLNMDALGFVVKSRFKQNAEEEQRV